MLRLPVPDQARGCLMPCLQRAEGDSKSRQGALADRQRQLDQLQQELRNLHRHAEDVAATKTKEAETAQHQACLHCTLKDQSYFD